MHTNLLLRNSSSSMPHLVHVVRRYGPVGGMERYVWELTLQLHKMGYRISVICERCHAAKPEGILVYELGEIAQRPRWVAALRFSWRVARWLEAHPQPDCIVHSHERIRSHDITTFHSSPFATVYAKPWWKRISLRVAMQLFLERRELSRARCIVPNSQLIKRQLKHYYPEFADKLTEPVAPGITTQTSRPSHIVPADGGIIGFIGKEWKRKGLTTAVAAIKQLHRARPNLQFIVIGPEVKNIAHLFANCPAHYVLQGWRDSADYTRLDVLFHPAQAEPYGMVISEAMAASLPVVISDACGASMHVSAMAGEILHHNAPLTAWANALDRQLKRSDLIPEFERSWHTVAREYEPYWQFAFSVKRTAVLFPSLRNVSCHSQYSITP